jgi:phosphoenolpyruvate-protein kinase (PTS system EI component)
MSAPAIPEVRYVLRRTDRQGRESLAGAVLASADPASSAALIREFAAARLRARA